LFVAKSIEQMDCRLFALSASEKETQKAGGAERLRRTISWTLHVRRASELMLSSTSLLCKSARVCVCVRVCVLRYGATPCIPA
jgi:hypothetical protein